MSQRQGKFRCPECQAEIDLPQGNRFDRLLNSFLNKSLLGVLEAEDRQAIPRQQQETCSQHTEERVRYYCISCEACIYEDHRGHAFDLLEKAVQEDTKNLIDCRDHQGKGRLVSSRVKKIRENIRACGNEYRNR